MAPLATTLHARSPEETRAWGRALGALLQPGDFVGLVGNLGAGKTVFARGVAEGAEVAEDAISSPTFAIINAYEGRLPLFHVDLYRLEDAKELHGTGYGDLDGAMLVEWVDRIPEAAPADALRIVFHDEGPTGRRLEVHARGPRSEALAAKWLSERVR